MRESGALNYVVTSLGINTGIPLPTPAAAPAPVAVAPAGKTDPVPPPAAPKKEADKKEEVSVSDPNIIANAALALSSLAKNGKQIYHHPLWFY